MATNINTVTIYQWNCRSFNSKKAQLGHYVTQSPPDIIALQETDTPKPQLSGYATFTHDPGHRTAVLVAKALTAQEHPIPSSIAHTFVEIIPTRPGQPSLFILNIYSPPQHPLRDIDPLLNESAKRAGPNPLLLLGDFNAPHHSWGYPQATKKGTALLHAAQHHMFTLCNDLTLPTRLGTSVTRDTTPDLTFARNAPHLEWARLPDTLGSDHYILALALPSLPLRRRIGQATLVDWSSFRKDPTSLPPADEDLEQWTARLTALVRKHTKIIPLTTANPSVDFYLDHLWGARRGLVNRWKNRKHNRSLKRRIAEITQRAAQYAEELRTQNWRSFCDKLGGTLGTKRTWHILRHLLGSKPSKTTAQQQLQRLIHNHPHPHNHLLDAVRTKLFGSPENSPIPTILPYLGRPNPDLDAPFTIQELEQALARLTRNTTPGKDRITNKTLRNLDDETLSSILTLFNKHWEAGTLPQEWRHSDIILVPKPHKPVAIDNLRPISLTSCLGKLFEHMVHYRLTTYLEDNDLYPHTMFGFRAHLSAQDVLLQLKEQIIDNLSKTQPSTILALDVQGAFDNVTHEAILQGLQTTNCGAATYNFVRAFLRDRTATIRLGTIQSDPFPTPAKGTPQGSVISPLLFNIALLQLPAKLSTIPNLHHAFYADDLTMWTNTGSAGQQQDNIQQAIDYTLEYLQRRGLTCAPQKSALLVLRARTRGRPPQPTPDPSVTISSVPVPQVTTLRILGVPLQADGSGAALLPQLHLTVTQLTHLIRRVCTQHHGLREKDTCQLIHAVLISRIIYGAPYVQLKPKEHSKLDALIRRTYKIALGLPAFTPTTHLLRLGLHNTLSELLEAQQVGQLARLSLTPTGRTVLTHLGRPAPTALDAPQRMPTQIRAHIKVSPIPRHMHPTYNVGRRQARVRLLERRYSNDPNTRYTDVATYPNRTAHTMVALNAQGSILTSATIADTNTTTAEETAIALAATTAPTGYVTILTDSQQACRNFLTGCISPPALKLLQTIKTLPYIQVVWTPGHASLPGNEAAHAAARDILLRAFPSGAGNSAASSSNLPVPSRYTDILHHYRQSRLHYPPPHPSLSTCDARIWRRLQTETYFNTRILHHISPTTYPYNCPTCYTPNTTYHLVWECADHPNPLPSPTPEQWECGLTSSQLGTQERLTSRARAAAVARGFLN